MSSDDIRRRMDLQTDKLIDRENIVIEDYYYLLTVYMKIKTFLETLRRRLPMHLLSCLHPEILCFSASPIR